MSLSPDYFEQMFEASDDPWSFRTRWYEKRKRELTLASLTRQRYQRVFEPACANGELSAVLAERSDALFCQDINAKAVTMARQRLSGLQHVRVGQARIPQDWPSGRCAGLSLVASDRGLFAGRPRRSRGACRTPAPASPGAP